MSLRFIVPNCDVVAIPWQERVSTDNTPHCKPRCQARRPVPPQQSPMSNPAPDPHSRIQSLEEHQLFLERQIEDLSSEVLRLGTLIHSLKSQLDHERDRLSKLSDALHDKPQPDQH